MRQKTAYSIIELSISILVLAALLTGALEVFNRVDIGDKEKVTKDKITKIYKAMGTYLLENGHLPCPSAITLSRHSSTSFGEITGTDGDCDTTGVYDDNGTPTLVYGMVPTKDLNLPSSFAIDAFGNKFTYIVAKNFTVDGTSNSFGTATPTGLITVKENVAGTEKTATLDAIMVIISHGLNGSGAFAQNRAAQNSLSSDSEEAENHLDGSTEFDTTFFAVSTNSETFDDIVFFKSRDQIVVDFEAFDKVYCAATSEDITYGASTTFNWVLSKYNAIVEATEDCPQDLVEPDVYDYQIRNLKPTKRCGPLGQWESGVITPCHDS